MDITLSIKEEIEEKKKEHLRKVKEYQEIIDMFKNKKRDFNTPKDKYIPCLHDGCPECVGTGVKITSEHCIHYISCLCPKCTPTY